MDTEVGTKGPENENGSMLLTVTVDLRCGPAHYVVQP